MAQVTVEKAMKGPSPPTPPDPAETAGAQTANNVTTAVANHMLTNYNQQTPWGSLEFQQNFDDQGNPITYQVTDPNTGNVFDLPSRTAITSLSDEQQQLFDTNQRTQQGLADIAENQTGRIGGLLSEEIDLSGLPEGANAGNVRRANMRTDVPGQRMQTNFNGRIANAGPITRSYGTDFSEDRRRVEEAIGSRMNPQLDRDYERLRSSLINQGVREGSEAWDRAFDRFGRQSNDARMQAILAGGQEQSRMVGLERDRAAFQNQAQMQQFGQNEARRSAGNEAINMANAARGQQFGIDLSRANFQNNSALQQQNADMGAEQFSDQVRAARMGELFALRNQPLNEISALMSGSQVQSPQFVNYNAPQIPTVDRAGLEMDAFNGQMQGWQAQNANRQNLMGGLFGLAGNVISGF